MFEAFKRKIEDTQGGSGTGADDTAKAPAASASGVSWPVPLLGKRVSGPFSDVDEEGAPLIELYEMVPDLDAAGRRIQRPCFIESVSHRLTRNDLLNDETGELGRRHYLVMVKGADGLVITRGEVDLRPPDEVRRQILRPNRQRRNEPAEAAAAAPALGNLDAMQQLMRDAVKAERERVEAERDRLVMAIEADRNAWKARAEQAETKVADLKDEVQELKIEAIRAMVGQGKGGLDIEGLVAHAEQIQRAQEKLGLLTREDATPAAPRPSLTSAMVTTVRDVQSAASSILDIIKLGSNVAGVTFQRA